MLTEKEISFIQYWEAVREEQSKLTSKFKNGLPMAILFSFPMFLSLAAVYFLSPDWYTKISQQANGSIAAILTSILIIIFFFSFARMHFKWEMNENLYRELKAKMNHPKI